jgi:hypothetical protein
MKHGVPNLKKIFMMLKMGKYFECKALTAAAVEDEWTLITPNNAKARNKSSCDSFNRTRCFAGCTAFT